MELKRQMQEVECVDPWHLNLEQVSTYRARCRQHQHLLVRQVAHKARCKSLGSNKCLPDFRHTCGASHREQCDRFRNRTPGRN